MKLSMQSLARKLSIPSPKRGGKKDKRGISRSEAPSFASTSSTSSSEEGGGALARSSTAPSPRSVLLQPAEVSRRELEAVLRRLGHAEQLSAEDLDAVAAIAANEDAGSGGDQDELMEAFRVFDADGDGRIDAEELRGVMAAILADGCSLDDCRRMIGGVDADGDGFVGFQDFARMMMTVTTTAAATTAAATDGPRFL